MTRRILLADDSVTIRRVVELTFSDEDFSIDAVGDGAAALERARAARPDIIIADVALPGWDGYELCRKVKSDPSLGTVPFLFLKGAFDSFDEGKADSCGADGFIVKPFESQEMIDRVKELIARPAFAPAAPPARAAAAPGFPETPGLRFPPSFAVAAGQPAPAPPPAPAARPPGEDVGFDLGEALSEHLGPAVPTAPPSAAPGPEPVPAPAAELEEDLWSEVSLRGQASEFLDAPPPAGAAGRTGGGARDLEEESDEQADELLFEELLAPRSAALEPEPEAVRAIVSSLATPPPSPAPGPRPAVDNQEIERLVAARLEDVVRQVLEPVVKDLARTMIETISWEVIPDLAEAMIRAEIERITQSTRTG